MKIDLSKVREINVEARTSIGGTGFLCIAVVFIDGDEIAVSDDGGCCEQIERKIVDEFHSTAARFALPESK